MKLKVIYEDNHLLVCEKPANTPIQADASGDEDLLTQAKAYIKEKYAKPGDVYLGLVHRLDRPVGGVVVFARTSKAAARLTESFKKRATRKRYVAVTVGQVDDYGYLKDYLLRDEDKNITLSVPKDTPGAKEASLDYTCITRKSGMNLLDIDLHSGRHHQIRVQLASRGFPIYGDQRYNRSAQVGQQIALFAYSLTIEHPTLRTEMTFSSIPSGGIWKSFSEELNGLSFGLYLRYIDENLMVINKKAGISCTEADSEDKSEASIERRLGLAFGKNNVYPVHRLDVLTQGLVLFAKNRQIQSELVRLIKLRKIKKIYHAECFGKPEKASGRLTLYAVKDSENAFMHVYDKPVSGSVEMITDYRLLDYNGETSLIELSLVTGRTHQIRASLAHIGCPIVGDDRYGDRIRNRKNKSGLHLAATEIALPSSDETIPELADITVKNKARFEILRFKDEYGKL